MSAEERPTGMTPRDAETWDAFAPGSWQRGAIALGYRLQAYALVLDRRGGPRRTVSGETPGPVETAEVRAALPGERGLECIVYEHVARQTVHLRRGVYITIRTEAGEFRPSVDLEHSPVVEPQRYQVDRGILGGEAAYGRGRSLEVDFVCYAPEGSGAADEAAGEILDALEHLEDVAGWGDWQRSMFGMRHGRVWREAAIADGAASYRPPSSALPSRSEAPKRAGVDARPKSPEPPGGPSFSDVFRTNLEAWGALEDYGANIPPAPKGSPPLYPPAEQENLRRWARDLENELAKTTNGRTDA